MSFERKIKEALLALRIERTYSKQKILELYLNEIYLGFGAYGVAAASLLYFDKSVHELTIAEAAYLAALPKGPNNYNPFRRHDEAVARRNYVIDRMAEDGYITTEAADKAKKAPLERHRAADRRAYFRRRIFRRRSAALPLRQLRREEALRGRAVGAHHARSQSCNCAARQTMVNGLVNFDESTGYRGAVTTIDVERRLGREARRREIAVGYRPVADGGGASGRRSVGAHRLAAGARSRAAPWSRTARSASLPLDGVKWAKPASGPGAGKPIQKVSQVLAAGDVIYVEPMEQQGQYRLRQVPEISGAMVVMDPHTGRVLAMVGGFSFDQSQFNRATQALRQPGSSFKPIVYAAALDNGYTPSTIVMDAPIEIDMGQGGGIWRPENYGGKFFGPSTLRFGLEESRNVMTVRLAQDIGMPLIAEYAKRFGVYDELPPYLSYALGAGETTVLRMVTAYSMFDNGGRRVIPTLIDRIQDRYGHTIYKHDQRECQGCDATKWDNQPEPTLDRPPRAGDRSDDGLSDHLADGRRRPARHGDRRARGRQADCRQDRHHQRREGRLVRRLFARHRLRRLYGLRQAAPYRAARDRRPSRRAGRAATS